MNTDHYFEDENMDWESTSLCWQSSGAAVGNATETGLN
jgi:hypothetical protein